MKLLQSRDLWASMAVAVVGLALVLFPLGDAIRRWSYDLLFLFRGSTSPEDVVIVYMDEQSHLILEQPYDRIWDRKLHAELVDRLTGAGARMVIFDVVFDGPSSEAGDDKALAEAIARHGNVVLGGDFSVTRDVGVVQNVIVPPFEILRKSARAWGLLWLERVDPDFGVRLMSTGTESKEAATWAAARLLDPAFEGIAGERLQERWINYYGPPSTMPSFSYYQLLEDKVVAEDLLRDKVVFIGSRFATGFTGTAKDQFRTPYSLTGYPLVNGVEIQATLLVNLRKREWLNRLNSRWEASIAILFGLVVTWGLSRLRPYLAMLTFAGISLTSAGLSIYLAWTSLTFYSWLIPTFVQAPLGLIGSLVVQYYVERRRRMRLKSAFSTYLSPGMADRITDTDYELKPGGEIRQVSLMFTDIKGFTSLVEGTAPDDVALMLNHYFNLVSRCIVDRNGTILQYIGDAVFAVWGAPFDDPLQAEHAVSAAIAIQEATSKRRIFGHSVRTRIGINSGDALAGNWGADWRFDYAVTGENTVLASRLESLNKQFGTNILISDSTRQLLPEGFLTRFIGDFYVVGKEASVKVHEVLGRLENGMQPREWTADFAEGVDLFAKREFDSATIAFKRVVSSRLGGDGASEFYLNMMPTFIEEKEMLADGWRGEIRLEKKQLWITRCLRPVKARSATFLQILPNRPSLS